MKLVVNIKLTPTPEEADVRRRILERVNEVCNWLATRAIESRTIRQFDLHKLCSWDLRKHFELTAQVAIRCIAKVADAYKTFGQLQTLVAYKARRAGISVLSVDPKYTRKGGLECGATDDKNRPNQATFSCISCGHPGHADVSQPATSVAGQRPSW